MSANSSFLVLWVRPYENFPSPLSLRVSPLFFSGSMQAVHLGLVSLMFWGFCPFFHQLKPIPKQQEKSGTQTDLGIKSIKSNQINK